MKKIHILFTGILLLTTLFAFAQQVKPVVFKFVARNDMFFLQDNKAELERLYSFVERYRSEITGGQMPIHVDGYCTSFDSRRDNLNTATVRANRVKSELIVKKELQEENFITAVHAESYEGRKEVVVVSFVLEDFKGNKDSKGSKDFREVEQTKREQKPAEQPQTVEKSVVENTKIVEQPAATVPWERSAGELSIRTNLLYWAVATPNLGVEWKPSNRFGILVNGAYSHWIWSEKNKHHRTWLVQPEVRYYLGESKQWFVGIEGHTAQFNFKFGDTGYQGDALGGGITGGYRLCLSKCFDMDFSLGLGYTHFEYDSYYRSNDVMVRKESNLKKNVFSPTQAGVSLIFKL